MTNNYKSLKVELGEDNRPKKSLTDSKTIFATALAGSIDEMAKEAVDLLATYTEFDAVFFEFNSFWGKFKVVIKSEYNYDDAVDYVNGLLKIQQETEDRRKKLEEKITKRAQQRKTAGV